MTPSLKNHQLERRQLHYRVGTVICRIHAHICGHVHMGTLLLGKRSLSWFRVINAPCPFTRWERHSSEHLTYMYIAVYIRSCIFYSLTERMYSNAYAPMNLRAHTQIHSPHSGAQTPHLNSRNYSRRRIESLFMTVLENIQY